MYIENQNWKCKAYSQQDASLQINQKTRHKFWFFQFTSKLPHANWMNRQAKKLIFFVQMQKWKRTTFEGLFSAREFISNEKLKRSHNRVRLTKSKNLPKGCVSFFQISLIHATSQKFKKGNLTLKFSHSGKQTSKCGIKTTAKLPIITMRTMATKAPKMIPMTKTMVAGISLEIFTCSSSFFSTSTSSSSTFHFSSKLT